MRSAVYRYPNPTLTDCDAVHTAAHRDWWGYVTAHLGDPFYRAVPGVRHPDVSFADSDRARAAADRLPIDDSAGARIDLDRPSDLSPRAGRTDPDRRTVLIGHQIPGTQLDPDPLEDLSGCGVHLP